jgi:hypothetical protein
VNLGQWEQQDLSAESCYHKYLLHKLIAKVNRSSSTLSGSNVRSLITQTSRWHANEQDPEAHSVDNARPVSLLAAIL